MPRLYLNSTYQIKSVTGKWFFVRDPAKVSKRRGEWDFGRHWVKWDPAMS
jgi:hypothetical protein